ncbi:MAG: hypothetical protein ABSF46_27865 [Terriglobia bacterium]|jgi:hypothetical protein
MSMEIIPHPAGLALPALTAGQGTCADPKQTYSPCDRKRSLKRCPPDQIETIKTDRLNLSLHHLQRRWSWVTVRAADRFTAQGMAVREFFPEAERD